MPTYKVYISRANPNNSISWDFSKTVIANDAEVALQEAYNSWVNNASDNSIPSLNQCDSRVPVL